MPLADQLLSAADALVADMLEDDQIVALLAEADNERDRYALAIAYALTRMRSSD